MLIREGKGKEHRQPTRVDRGKPGSQREAAVDAHFTLADWNASVVLVESPTLEESFPEDGPLKVRRASFLVPFFAAVLLLPPRQWASAGICALIALVFFVRHRRLRRREEVPRPKAEATPDPGAKSVAGDVSGTP
jgi:hypothetical protein